MSRAATGAVEGIKPIPKDVQGLAPQPLADASQALRDADQEVTRAGQAVREAEAKVKTTERADRNAAADAADEGDRLPQPKTPKAQQELDRAQRKREAAREVAHRRRKALQDLLKRHGEDFAAALRAELEEIGSEAAGYLDGIEAGLVRRRSLEGGLRGLVQPYGDFPVRSKRDRGHRDLLKGAPREKIEALRAELEGER